MYNLEVISLFFLFFLKSSIYSFKKNAFPFDFSKISSISSSVIFFCEKFFLIIRAISLLEKGFKSIRSILFKSFKVRNNLSVPISILLAFVKINNTFECICKIKFINSFILNWSAHWISSKTIIIFFPLLNISKAL